MLPYSVFLKTVTTLTFSLQPPRYAAELSESGVCVGGGGGGVKKLW